MTARTLLSGGCVLTLGAKTPNLNHADVLIEDGLVAEVKSALRACAAWHKTPQVVVRYAAKPGLAERLSD